MKIMSESHNVEWKESWRDEYLKWICGFANAKGGKLYIGKSDNGTVCGISDFEKLLEDIPNKIVNHLGIVCDVNLLETDGKHFIEIIVPAYDVPISYHGKYHYRSGSTKQELHGSALNDFLLRKIGKTWDDVIEPNATFDDIDNKAIASFKKEANKSMRLAIADSDNDLLELFLNLRLLEDGKLKRAALLLFGKDPRKFYISAFIKIGRFGRSDSDLLSQETIEGNVFEIADLTMEILDKKYFKSFISYNGLHRIETPEYPYSAVREILLNAVVHRQYTGTAIQISIYDDKLMVWNYGTLPQSIQLNDLKHKHASHPRNPILADVFFKAGLIEAWGRGTLKVIEECKAANLPEPLIEELSGGICVTIFKKRHETNILEINNLNERQKKAIVYLRENGKITNKNYQDINQVSRETASRDLAQLLENGILKSSGIKGAGSFFTFN